MERLSVIDPGTASGPLKAVFDQAMSIVGRVPRMMRLLAHSPAAAQAYLSLNRCLAHGVLSPSTRALIAVVVAEEDNCDYSRLIARGQAHFAGVPEAQVLEAVEGRARNPRVAAALGFALELVEQRGRVSAGAITALAAAGDSEAEIVEIIASVVLGVFRNYFNLAIGTELDPLPATAGA